MDGEPELLDSGRPDNEGALRRLRRAHPRVMFVALAVAVLAGAGWVAARALASPDLQALSVDELILVHPGSEAEPQGRVGSGAVRGRDLRITVTAPGLESGDEPWQVAALGLVGPGIVAPNGPAEPPTVRLEPDLPVFLIQSVAVDCGAIPLPVDAAEYGLRVFGGVGDRRATGVLPLGLIAEAWARAVDVDCARAEAVRTVRVLSVSGEVDPTGPTVDVRFLLENDGPHVVEVVPEVSYSAEPVRTFELSPGVRQEVPARMTLDPCPTPDPQWGSEGARSWPVGMTAAVAGILNEPGQGPPLRRPRLDLDAAASQTLDRLLTEACAGLPTLVIDAPAEGVRLDPRTLLIEGSVVVDPPPGFLGRLSVSPVDDLETGLGLEPLWSATTLTAPGDTEPVAVPVRYRIRSAQGFCGAQGLRVPLDVYVRVPSGATERTARLRGEVQLPWPPGVEFAVLVRAGC